MSARQRRNERARKRAKSKVGVLDFETDPFLAGRIPEPFACEVFFSDSDFFQIWEPDIVGKVISALRSLPPCILYAHNGGKFDFHFLIEFADPQDIKIRNGRIAEMRIGQVTLRDSYPLMPFPLAEFKKTPIEYAKFEKEVRDLHRAEICAYMHDDCRDLLELLTGFKTVVGEKETIGSAAFAQMRKLGVDILRLNEQHDELLRPYFFGGRVEAFQKGKFNGRYLYLDVNSAYPYAMRFRHPHGAGYMRGGKLPFISALGPNFARIVARSRGALPMRAGDGSLRFPHESGEFYATGWEIRAGIETGTLDVLECLDFWEPEEYICFDKYVDTFFELRQKAKEAGDEIHRLAYKYLLNSGYGKFAQNPRDFKEYKLAPFGEYVTGYDWESDFGAISLWSKPNYDGSGFFDVATSASITGFQRAVLWRGICASRGTLYCDTDAILCESSKVAQGPKLGEWKLEGIAEEIIIAGKKLYGLRWENKEEFKIASKGARLSYKELLSLADGESVEWTNPAPTFGLKGAHFISRRINAT